MKRRILILLFIIVNLFTLSACFDYTEHPNMIEYQESEVLEIAKEKYDIKEWIFTGQELDGSYKENELTLFNEFKIINPKNFDNTMTSFAGKNGNHDVQGRYSNFLCYYGLGINYNNEAKFIYYNYNLDKNASIIDTIGISDYPYDVLPTEIPVEASGLFKNIEYNKLYLGLNNCFKSFSPKGFNYSRDRLTVDCSYYYSKYTKGYMEFYKENGNIVFDYYVLKKNEEEYQLVYSSSNRYQIYFHQYGYDVSNIINIDYSVEENNNMEVIKGYVKLDENKIDGTIIFSKIISRVEYFGYSNVNNTNKITTRVDDFEGEEYVEI